MPYDALLALIWWQNPCNPDEMDNWPIDRVMRMLWYLEAHGKLKDQK